MKTQTNECNPDQLQLLLAGQLGEAEQVRAAKHLEDCEDCRQQLEELAGNQSWWNEASGFLRPTANDFVPESQSSSAPLLSTDEIGPLEFALDFLEPSDNPAMIGRLGDYEILELIGRGGMGVVLKGYQRELNRYVSVKVMAPHYANSGAARKRFAREARAAAAVVHPHVVAIHSVDDTAKLPYLVMPFVAGESLQERIDSEGPLELKEILRIGKQAAEGLAAAHAQGLVHRDVKPANILLEDDVGRVLLTDFGLARAVDDATLTRSGIIAGTPQYMSPEQAHGEAIDHRADLFSLGSVLYAISAGHPPFRAETTMGILRRICEETPRPICEVNPDLPPWLGRLIERLHAKDPAERFQSADEVAEILGQCLAHVQQPTVVPLPESLRNPPPGSRWARIAIWSGSIAALCVVVAVAATFVTGNRPAAESASSQQPSPSNSSTTASASSSTQWNDGADEMLLQLDADSAELERQANQLWDDDGSSSQPTLDANSPSFPEQESKP